MTYGAFLPLFLAAPIAVLAVLLTCAADPPAE
jgi:hypothetical protein